jgi:hypothetical protein
MFSASQVQPTLLDPSRSVCISTEIQIECKRHAPGCCARDGDWSSERTRDSEAGGLRSVVHDRVGRHI